MKKKFLNKAMALVFATGLLFSIPSAAGSVKAEENSSENTANVIYISDAKEWNALANSGSIGSGVIVKLKNDIAFDGVSNNNYSMFDSCYGTFDGCGHTISGMISTDYAGLFSCIGKGGVVKNVTVADSEFLGGGRGVITDENLGTIDNCKVRNTTLQGTQEKKTSWANDNGVGGICGTATSFTRYVGNTYGKIENCVIYSDVVISGPDYVGGICGGGDIYGRTGTAENIINNCVNLGTVKGKHVSGICAISGILNNCYSAGDLICETEGYPKGLTSYGSVWNCYYADETADSPGCSVSASNRFEVKTRAEMASQAFCDQLNANIGTNSDWFDWVPDTTTGFPVIAPLTDISLCKITVGSGYKYKGIPVIPSVVVTYNNRTLVNATDYTVSYDNNEGAGIATITITGTGKYTNAASRQFAIEKGDTILGCANINNKTYTYGDSVDILPYASTGEMGNVTYTSSNKNVASVSAAGKINFCGIGSAVITVNSAGTANYNGASIKLTVKSIPKKPSVSLKSKKGKITIKYNKSPMVSGYEIQYSQKKGFKSKVKTLNTKKTNRTISKLKKYKKYYVRVRAYKKVGKNNIYSKWSKVKSIKVK